MWYTVISKGMVSHVGHQGTETFPCEAIVQIRVPTPPDPFGHITPAGGRWRVIREQRSRHLEHYIMTELPSNMPWFGIGPPGP